MMMIEGEKGLIWKSPLPKGDTIDLLLTLDTPLIEKMDTTLFKKVHDHVSVQNSYHYEFFSSL